MKTRGVHHLAVQVRDLARAEAFWCGVLGLEPVRRQDDGEGQPRSTWVEIDELGTFIALERVAPATPPGPFVSPTTGAHLVALRIARDERAAWIAKLEAAGFAIERRTPYTIYVRDPDGTRVGLSHYPTLADPEDPED